MTNIRTIARAAIGAVFLSLLLLSCAAHNTGIPHREYTPAELRELGLEELIPIDATASTTSIAVEKSSIPTVDFSALSHTWVYDPGILLTLALAAGLYCTGTVKLWRATHVGAGITRTSATWYALGWISLVIALVSPLHPWGEVLFSAHMTQHEILMLVSAPLLVLGRPLVAFLWAFPSSWRRAAGKGLSTRLGKKSWDNMTNPFVAWIIHGVCLWIWHIPSWFQATLHNDFIHTLQHASFLGSALLFWWAILYGRRRKLGYGMGVVYLFTTAVHSGTLGALLIFTRSLWYPAYAGTAAVWGMTPLEDQQLGGLIMWVPAGLVYIAAALLMFTGWLRESERQVVIQQKTWLSTARTSDPAAGNAL